MSLTVYFVTYLTFYINSYYNNRMIETIGFALIEISDNATFIIVMLLAIGEIRYIKKRRDSL